MGWGIVIKYSGGGYYNSINYFLTVNIYCFENLESIDIINSYILNEKNIIINMKSKFAC